MNAIANQNERDIILEKLHDSYIAKSAISVFLNSQGSTLPSSYVEKLETEIEEYNRVIKLYETKLGTLKTA